MWPNGILKSHPDYLAFMTHHKYFISLFVKLYSTTQNEKYIPNVYLTLITSKYNVVSHLVYLKCRNTVRFNTWSYLIG